MALPKVVIVGRPNVGKSSLLNLLSRQRISIVDPRAGITRDRVGALIEHDEHYFELIDTGGIGIVDDDNLEEHVETQIRFAIKEADVILFVVDIRDGIMPLDEKVADLLRKLERPVIVCANKVDEGHLGPEAAQFAGFGLGEPVALSAAHGYGRHDLLDRLVPLLGAAANARPDEPVMKLAIVGKRNAGKSTLVNALAGDDRVIVSEVPGTTRDAVDVEFDLDGHRFIAIDTAGVRKKSSMNDIDFYAHTRVLHSIKRADVALLLVDAEVPIAEVDLKLARAIQDEYKPMVVAINKWDLAQGRASSEQYAEYLTQVMPAWRYAPLTFLTAKDNKNVRAAVEVAQGLFKQARTRVGTGRLNSVLQAVLAERSPTPKRGVKSVRILYATQVGVSPPTLVFFCNNPGAVTENFQRFLENRLREVLPFKEVPLRLMFRSRH
jgi:GTPase